jgi:hypothetical protein
MVRRLTVGIEIPGREPAFEQSDPQLARHVNLERIADQIYLDDGRLASE